METLTDHSLEEQRFIIVGSSEQGRITVAAHTGDGEVMRIINAREQLMKRESLMKKIEAVEGDELRPEKRKARTKGAI